MLELSGTQSSGWVVALATFFTVIFAALAIYSGRRLAETAHNASLQGGANKTVDIDWAPLPTLKAQRDPKELTWAEVRGGLTALPNAEDLARVEERLAAIEERFPDAAAIDKIASVNDAIMATKIEALEKTVVELQSKMLTRWDVALVLFAVLGALSALVGVFALVSS